MRSEKIIKEEILDKVQELYRLRYQNNVFIPGETKVNYAGRVFDEKEMTALVDSALDFWLTLGSKGREFCDDFSNYLGTKHCLVTNSGSSSNLIAISALCSPMIRNPMKAGDEVITTAMTFPTTLNPIIQNGLVPVFVDIEEDTYNIDASKIELAITDKTRAIVFAHTLGNPAEMDKITDIARKYDLYVVEDTCDGLDSTYDGKLCGTFGHFSTYSFYAAHHMTMGEGGAICTNSTELYRTALSIRDWGRACFCQTGESNPNGACDHRFDFKFEGLPDGYDHKYVYNNIGYNLKPLDLQCAIGIEQLKKLAHFTERRKYNFKALYDCFKQYEDKFILPRALPKADPSWFAIPITLRESAGFSRKDFITYLEAKKIETRMLFAGNILKQPGYKNINHRVVGGLNYSNGVLERTLFLGVYPGLTEEKLEYMIETIDDFFKTKQSTKTPKIKQKIDQTLLQIDELIRDNLVEEAYESYIELMNDIESKNNEIDYATKANVYASFAYFLFRLGEYKEFLNMLIKAQDYGYSKDEIQEVIWEGFIEPNLSEFKCIYEQNIDFLLLNGYIRKSIAFEDLPFWLIPTGSEDEYYIYAKNEKLIKEKLSFGMNGHKEYSDSFADFLILAEWNWKHIEPYINAIRTRNRKSYIVVKDLAKFLSCLQGKVLNENIISDVLILDGFESMKEYFKGCSEYLPRNIIDLTGQIEEAKGVIDEIHNYRITKEGRRGDNILLSIAVPSWNRGKRAYDNIINSLRSYYDEEIEIVLSNNGSQNETKVYYDMAREIEDARLNYFAFDENQGFAINVCQVCEMARGKYVLLTSDEDLVNIDVLHGIMSMLRDAEEPFAIVRAKTDGQGFPPSTKLAKAGREALLTYMLTSNYMPGMILNTELLRQYNVLKFVKENLNNSFCSYYPHMVFELLLCQYGNVQGTNIVFIAEGEVEEIDPEGEQTIGINNKMIIPYYASIEGRIDQHKNILSIFKDMEIVQDFNMLRQMYMKLCSKTFHLLRIAIHYYYIKTDSDLFTLLNQVYEVCIKYLNDIYSTQQYLYKEYYLNDLKEIKAYYEYCSKIINEYLMEKNA